jgi:hypothetical protein
LTPKTEDLNHNHAGSSNQIKSNQIKSNQIISKISPQEIGENIPVQLPYIAKPKNQKK